MQVGSQLSWIIASGSVVVRCLNEQTFDNMWHIPVCFYLHVFLFILKVSFSAGLSVVV